ncbi:MAG: prephenate dehydratase [candidate division KSB1 bacterium]|nr:prephenate dehydratase [candidate division KSB1 bacterium]MDZ7367496.1 prephenate dehydratase [candidate division KSB1 bacterium]MDZ7404945.1 prephenate dehydratase [candidate division KSB1 bacterium]
MAHNFYSQHEEDILQHIAFQGEAGAYSERAAKEFFREQVITTIPCRTFGETFAAVHDDKVAAAVVPIENSLAGSVHQNYDLLLKHELHITGEIFLRISHQLMALPATKWEQVRRVYSHPQALEQCREFLEKWPAVEAVPAYDTAGSAKLLVENQWHDAAAIASEWAAEKYGLNILHRGIESNQKNYTRFLLLEKQERTPTADGKTSIVFSVPHTPGSLFKALAIFALRDINLLKIESRPLHGSPWEYVFYLDFEGTPRLGHCEKALEHLDEIATFRRVLGTYEKGRVIE